MTCRKIVTLVVLGLLASAPARAAEPAGTLERIAVSPDGRGFVEAGSGKPFVPVGTNYFDPTSGWPPKVWATWDPVRADEHFRLMRSAGVNVARVFPQVAHFQPEPGRVSDDALRKFDELVTIARKHGIRLLVTGPGAWEGDAAYWGDDRYGGEVPLRALEHYRRVMGERYKGDPIIFGWDLLNEPKLPWTEPGMTVRWNAWLRDRYKDRDALEAAWAGDLADGETFGRIQPPPDEFRAGSRKLVDYQLFREDTADGWVRRQAEAAHAVDPGAIITVGYIQYSYPLRVGGDKPSGYSAFNPQRQARLLDCIQVHYYPPGNPYKTPEAYRFTFEHMQAVLAFCHAGKPVFLGECGWYGGGAPTKQPELPQENQAEYFADLVDRSRPLCDGWLTWPFADTPTATDISTFSGLFDVDQKPKAIVEVLSKLAAADAPASLPVPALPPPPSTEDIFSKDLADVRRMDLEYRTRVVEALRQAGAGTTRPASR